MTEGDRTVTEGIPRTPHPDKAALVSTVKNTELSMGQKEVMNQGTVTAGATVKVTVTVMPMMRVRPTEVTEIAMGMLKEVEVGTLKNTQAATGRQNTAAVVVTSKVCMYSRTLCSQQLEEK